MKRGLQFAFVIIAAAASSRVARADIPPPDSSSCRHAEAGAPCTTDDGTKGTCVSETQQRMRPDGDGGMTAYTQPIMMCRRAAAASAGDGGAAPASPSKSSSGCSVTALGSPEVGSGVALLAVLLPFALRRRRPRTTQH